MNNIFMVVLNNVLQDSRVRREAITLSQRYNIEIIGLKQRNTDLSDSTFNNIPVHLITLKTKYLLPKNNFGWIIKYIEFIVKLNLYLLSKPVDFIHAHNLDALFPVFFLSKFKKAKIIYDSHELFTEMAGKKNNVINRFWLRYEKYVINKVNCVIAANKSRAEIMVKD